MTVAAIEENFQASLHCLVEPALDALRAELAAVDGLGAGESEAVLAATRESLLAFLHGKLARVLVLELNAARVTGRLDGIDAAQRWAQFRELSSQRSFWDELAPHYPSLPLRIERIVANRCAASLDFARHWIADKSLLTSLCGAAPGELRQLSFGAGDSHRGGLSVALLRCDGGRLVYKPRSVAIDDALHAFVAELGADAAIESSIRVPRVVDGGEHGWAEFVAHRYAADEIELAAFYRGIGHWLAIMRALGGSDLHAENLIAAGPSPVVVDCETLFTPRIAPHPSGFGEAYDQAAGLLGRSVLTIGLLPGRGQGLGWRGVDNSGIGMLPGQQPMMPLPHILEAGTDQAHIGMAMFEAGVAQNHPCAQPALARFWPDVLDAFDGMTAHLQRLDDSGALRQRLQRFADCEVRVVTRATEVYAEIGRMLWHPVSLHDDAAARRRAHDVLAKMARNNSIAPADPAVIEAEIDDLLDGDVPFFSTLARDGRLVGPRGTFWLAPCDLVEHTLQQWRSSDLPLERGIIQAALVSAYLNDGWVPSERSLRPQQVRDGDIDSRRRTQAATIMRRLLDAAIRGRDGSVAWIAPSVTPTGSSIQPIEQDLYGGICGIALLAAAYARETQAGRADPVDGVDDLLAATLHTLDLAEEKRRVAESRALKLRPRSIGAYIGLGSQIWTHLVLAHWRRDGGQGVQRARALADRIPAAAAAERSNDLIDGVAGAIAPLLALATASGESSYLTMACELGDLLAERAQHRDGTACWAETRWPDGMGGFAHGATGIGWALSRLARACGRSSYQTLAQAAFAFEDGLFDHDEGNWLDLRDFEEARSTAAWCHGSVGIGLAHVDLDPQLADPATRVLLRRAAAATWRMGFGANHGLCHGDLGAWELLDRAIALGEAPRGLGREQVLASILTSLEDHGPTCGVLRDTFVPGLMSGLGGIAYQLLRAHPDSALPSVLTLTDPGR